MRVLFALLFLCALYVPAARAESHTLVITGVDDRPSFRRTVQDIAAFSRATQKKFESLAFKKNLAAPDNGPSLLSARVRATAANVRAGESMLLFVNDHGDADPTKLSPLDYGIDLPGKRIYTNRQLQDDLSASLSPEARLVLIGTHCFSGGLHHLAFSRPNTCSGASTSHLSIANELPAMPGYNERIGKFLTQSHVADIDGDKKLSLYEAHLATVIGDVLNDARGQVSSSAFADFELGAGAYANRGAPTGPMNFIEGLAKLGFSASEGQMVEALTEVVKVPGIQGCLLPYSRERPLDEFLQIVSRAGKSIEAQLRAPAGFQPAALRPYVEYVQRQLRDAERNYGNEARERIREYAALRLEYQIAADAVGRPLSASDLALFTEKFEELEARARNPLAVLWNLRELLESFGRVQKFYLKADPAKRKKLEALLECEMRPL